MDWAARVRAKFVCRTTKKKKKKKICILCVRIVIMKIICVLLNFYVPFGSRH